MWLPSSMNLLLVEYRCSCGAISVYFPFKLAVASCSFAWYSVYYGTWNVGLISSTIRVGGVWFSTFGTRGVSTTTLGTRKVNSSTLRNWLPFCGRWVSGGCTAHLKLSGIVLMADTAGSSTFNCDYGVVFSREWINCGEAITASSTEEVLLMSKWWGKKSTVSEVLSALVLFM